MSRYRRRSFPTRHLPLLLLGSIVIVLAGSLLWDRSHQVLRPESPLPQTRLVSDPRPSPTPEEPLESVLARARTLRAEGSYEGAAAWFDEAVRRQAPDLAGAALAGAEAYLAAGNHERAVGLADRALQADPTLAGAHLVKARALLALGQTDAALSELESDPGPAPLRGYAAFADGEIRGGRGETLAAIDAYRRAVDLGLSQLWDILASRRIAEGYRALGEPGLAAGWLERATGTADLVERRGPPVWYDSELARRYAEARRPPLLLALAEARREAGQTEGAVAAYAELVQRYPTAASAGTALQALAQLEASDRVDPYQRGLALASLRRPEDAMLAFNAFLEGGPAPAEAASARYYAALARRAAGDPGAALAELTGMAQAYPESSLAPAALLQAARWTEAAGPRAEAIAAYGRVADSFPASAQAGSALLQRGWLQLWAGDADGARESWLRLGRQHPDPEARTRGLFWAGRGFLGLGQMETGRDLLEEAARTAPWTFEGRRARDLARSGLGAQPFVQAWTTRLGTGPASDDADCGAWIDSWSPTPSASTSAPAALATVDRLLAAGLPTEALAEALDAIGAAASTPRDLVQLSRGLAGRQLYPVAMYAADRLAAASPAGSVDRAPACVQRLFYPLAFGDMVQERAEHEHLDPYLLLSLMRQESWFGPLAHSGADARGLTQVVPSTGSAIAQALGRQEFSSDDLFRPRDAITFGAWYLGRQYESFGQRALLALAAYNAGPGSVTRWTGGDPGMDPDDFVQSIAYDETRTYVRTIYQTYGHYRELYP